MTTPSEEEIFKGKGYTFVKKLGQGAYGWVYLTDYLAPKEKKVVQRACKVIDTKKTKREYVTKFIPRELDILVKINHPYIIYVHGIFYRKAKYFIFMRFAENGDLLEFILKKGAVTEAQSRVWFRQISVALQYLHEMEIAHRDMKCENILLSSNFNVKIADFGFSRYTVDANGKKVASETYCGSLTYAAPEILKGSAYHPKTADIWSFGVILYVMLNKAMPFGEEKKIRKLLDMQLARQWRFRSKVIDVLSDEVKKLTECLLEPDISKRWKIEEIVCCDWIAMDPRLLELNQAELTALKFAQQQKKVGVSAKAPLGKKNIDNVMIKDITEETEPSVSYPMMQSADLRSLKNM